MLLVGLTGGIGSGKSTVASMLADHGAVVLDADRIVHDLQQPGTAVFEQIAARFPDVVVDGVLDRARLAALVFSDPDARAALNAIVHPAVWEVMQAELERLRASDTVVVLDVPLLVEGSGKAESTGVVDVVVVVETPEPERIARVREARGWAEDEVRARMSAQASDEQRRARADHVLVNDGSLEDLRAQVDRLWETLGR